MLTEKERFWQKVDRSRGPESCWIWTGGISKYGYGLFKLDNGKLVTAHKWIYEQEVGSVPSGLQLDHLCRVRHCQNYVEHLEIVTQRTNILRGKGVAAERAKQTHCSTCGLPLSGDNVKIEGKRSRRCLNCAKARKREWYERSKGNAS
jgi:hypothetical protein